MTNSEMKAGRILKLQRGRKLFRSIVSNIEAGKRIQITTYTRSTIYCNATMFRLGASGDVFAARGKSWDCIGPMVGPNIRAVA